MTTLAQMLAAKDSVGHCGLCHGECVKGTLQHVGLDRATLRGLALEPLFAHIGSYRRARGAKPRVGGTAAGVNAFPAPVFAALGHQESWSQISAIVDALRAPGQALLTEAELREIVPWIPPRTVSRLTIAAAPDASPIHGIYVDTFITPDELKLRPTRRVLDKVRDGIRAAQLEGVRVATLGGFTSILSEAMAIESDGAMALTTGNTLTAALIVRGVERAASLLGRSSGC